MMVLCLLLLVAWPANVADAQSRDRRGRREGVDRVEHLKQMRLIEELSLGEEDAVRFMAKRKEHEERMRGFSSERDSMLDGLGARLEGGADAAGIEPAVNRVLEQDRKMFEERRRYQDDMRKFLPAEKFARLLIFEREFQMQVRSAMGKNLKKRSSKFDD